MVKYADLDRIMIEIKQQGSITSDNIKELTKIVSMEKFLSAMEKITLEQLHKFIFSPSSRVIWIVNGKERDYLVYPKRFCSCMDFYLQGVVKNAKYYCKHLLAQQIFVNLEEKLVTKAVIELNDDKFNSVLKKVNIL